MSKETYYYKKKLSATTSEQTEQLPRLARMAILNAGPDVVYVEPDNAIDSDSVPIPVGSQINIGANYLALKYKADATTSTIYLTGQRVEKV